MARRTSRRGGSRRNNRRTVDFSEEVKYFEPDEDYAIEVKKAEWASGDEHDYIALEFCGVDEEYAEATLYHNASISPRALIHTRALLEALGMEIPKGELEIDVDELVGMQCMCHTFEDRYEGKKNVKAEDFWPLEKSTRTSRKKNDDEERPAGRRRSRDDNEEDKPRRGRRNRNDNSEEDEPKSSRRRGRSRGDGDEGESSGRSRRGRSSRGSRKSKTTWTEDEIQEMNEEELADVVEKADLQIDLEDFPSLRKKKNAVIEELESADMLEE